ncbi:hypothetical protein BaRGS_00004046, partial [Batillaria attramentaria]
MPVFPSQGRRRGPQGWVRVEGKLVDSARQKDAELFDVIEFKQCGDMSHCETLGDDMDVKGTLSQAGQSGSVAPDRCVNFGKMYGWFEDREEPFRASRGGTLSAGSRVRNGDFYPKK